jgi:hypothetical protein
MLPQTGAADRTDDRMIPIDERADIVDALDEEERGGGGRLLEQ